jgi:hypothetical protein
MNIQKITSIKKILIALLLCISASQTFAQSSNGIFFQAVARDNFSNPAKDRNIYVQSTIIQNTTTGTKVLIEVHKSSTDAMGVFNITIGNGQRTGGAAPSIAAIDWSKGPFYLNLKIAITPFSASDSWDYSKELVDMGTTSFGAVPFAFYSASSAKVDDKLNATDTTKMLAVYAKAMSVKTLETAVATKLSAADTLTMLAPYAKAAYTIDSNFFRTQLATKLSIADSAKYVTTTQLASYNFSSGGGGVTMDTSNLSNRINLKANATELTSLTSSLGNKINIADSTTKYVTPTQLSRYNFSSGGTTITIDTTSLSNRINLKANVLDMNSAIASEAAVARTAELALSNNIASNTTNIATNTTAIGSLNTFVASNTSNIATNNSAIAAEATTARAAELTLTNNLASNTASITANANAIESEATTARAAELILSNGLSSNSATISVLSNIISSNTASVTANTESINQLTNALQNQVSSKTAADLTFNNNLTATTNAINSLTSSVSSNTASIKANTTAIAAEATTARAAELALTNNINSNSISITANANAIASEATTARAAELVLTNNITSNTSSITANANVIASEATTARAAELVLTNNITSNSSSITSLNTIITAATNSNTANTIVKRDASGNFSAGSITASNYVSTPISLSYTGSTINWNPTVGANAAITLTQNSTLSFSATPLVGSYGTVVLTQDGTGNRTITLPSIVGVTNKVLGSASNTTVSLSTAASAKDILNFYYDGTNCYWNIGQGYGNTAAAGLILTTTGTGAATLSGTTLNIPSVSSTVNAGSLSGTIAVANGGTGVTTSTGTGNVVLSSSPTLITPALGTPSAVVLTSATGLPLTTGVTGTLAVGNGGTGATTLTGYIKGTGTTAMTASANIPVADITGAAPLASPTFTGTVTTSTINTGALSASSVTTPIYASTPQALTDGTTISWNPTLGLNASVTLAGNRTLSFTSTPAAGSYGTLVVTQDATGGRTITLPSTTNKVLGSTLGTTIALSTTANAKDILNFYYDGTNCYWNIGQGYGNAPSASFTLTTTGTGAATLSGTTLNIPSISSTVNSSSISGTVAIANGGTNANSAATALSNLGGAPLASPLFTGVPQAPTATVGTNTIQIATTAFVTSAVTTAAPSDASTSAKGIIQLAGDLRGTATSPTVNTVGGVNSATIATFDTRITSATNNITSNTSSITSLNTNINAATNINTFSTIVKRDASGNFSAGTITANLTGNVTGSLTGNATTATTAGNVTGIVAIANGGTGATTVAAALTNLGAAPISSPIFTDIPQAPTAVVGTNTTQIATTAFVKSSIRLNSDEFTATLNQTVFTFTTGSSNTGAVQTPLTKPFMYINGTRIKNTAYTWTSGNTYVTYVPVNNNSYTLVAGDRVQFDYAY